MAKFRLAERLGMTVEELGQRMTRSEFVEWMAYDAAVEYHRERARERARNE